MDRTVDDFTNYTVAVIGNERSQVLGREGGERGRERERKRERKGEKERGRERRGERESEGGS